MHTIGDVAKKFGVTLRALRFYQDKGLIAPTRDGTRRLYSDADVARIGLIVGWARAGVTMRQIREALEYFDAGNAIALETYIAVCLSRIKQRLKHQMAAIEALQAREAA